MAPASRPAGGLAIDTPRSRRVGMASPPARFHLQNLDSGNYDFTPSPPSPSSPPIPARSPLRPTSQSISSGSSITSTKLEVNTTLAPLTRPQAFHRPATPPPLQLEDFASIVEDAVSPPFQMHHRALLSINSLDMDQHIEDNTLLKPKPLPLRPDSPPFFLSPDDETTSSSSSLPQQTPMTKRQHALHELLSSERAYASDLALIRGIHIPLALGDCEPLVLCSTA